MTAVVPRPDVEKAIAGVLHAANCACDYGAETRRADRAGHTFDAVTICDEIERRGWTVTRG